MQTKRVVSQPRMLKMASELKISHVLEAIEETWSNAKAPSDVAIRIWSVALTDVSDDELERALFIHLRDPQRGQFPPKPGDLIAALQGDGEDQVEEFIAVAIEKISTGVYRHYSPHGSQWDANAIRSELGVDALAAWTEAGGAAGFDEVESSKFAIKKFGELLRMKARAGLRSGRFNPARALGAATAKALSAKQRALPPKQPTEPITPERSIELLKAIRKKVESKKPQSDTEYEERVALLNKQRAQILAEGERP